MNKSVYRFLGEHKSLKIVIKKSVSKQGVLFLSFNISSLPPKKLVCINSIYQLDKKK